VNFRQLFRIAGCTAITAAWILFALSAVAAAEQWTSPDGFLSVTNPDPSRFEAVEPPPQPFLVIWVAADDRIRLGVTTSEIPANIKLIQSSVEEGFAEELGGDFTRLPSRTISGYEVWTMTGKNQAMEITQCVLRRGPSVYKLVAATLGDVKDQETIDRFISSLTIHGSAADAPPAPAQEPVGENAIDRLSEKIGGASLVLLIVLLIYLYIRRRM
jgi:hypothetical protein